MHWSGCFRWSGAGSIRGPHAFQARALPTELPDRVTRFDRHTDRSDLAADLTGFEPATSALTGRRALQAAPQVRNGVSRVARRFDMRLRFEQPFTVAECRREAHGAIPPGPGVMGRRRARRRPRLRTPQSGRGPEP